MIQIKKIRIRMGVFITVFCFIVPLFAEPILVSIKKGMEGDKGWVLFSFEGDVEWSGISQNSDGRLSLYFKGGSGDLNGSSVVLDARQDKRVYVKQLSQSPPIFRADIVFNVDQPIVILKKQNHMIVAFNDERLVSFENQGSEEDLSVPGTLYQITPEWSAKYMKTSLDFDSNFNWTGYIRHSADHVDLVFQGAGHNLDEESFTFTRGPLHTVKLFQSKDPVSKLKVSYWFQNVSTFSIAKKENQLVTQAYYSEDELLAASLPTGEQSVREEPQTVPVTKDTNPLPQSIPPSYAAQDVDALLNISSISTGAPAGTPELNTAPSAKEESSAGLTDTAMIENNAVESTREGDGILWDTPVSFEFRETSIKDALRLIARTNDLNMVIGEGVEGTVTMTLTEVTLRQALEKIVVTNGFDYIVDDNIIIVKTVRAKYAGGRVTKVYRLKYADAANVASIVKNIVTSDSLVQVFYPEFLQFIEDQQKQASGGGGSGQRYPGAGMNRMQFSPEAIQGIRRANILVVTERPDMIREIDVLISELDTPTKQIVIEARFFEISPESTDGLGINWQETWNVFNILPNDLGLTSVLEIDNDQGGFIDWDWRSGHLNPLQYQAVLQFLSTQKESKIISHPKLLAMENEEASISVGTTVPLPSITPRVDQPDIITYTFKEVNIQLNVVPHIGDNNEITMFVNPVVEQIVSWEETGSIRVPVTGKRSVNSIVKVRDGETVVVGGLIKNTEIKSVKRIPLLGSLPLLGKLFQQTVQESIQTDLVIFITPTIVKPS
jgi:type II secretory pathway component GspD/PulD (secretin)